MFVFASTLEAAKTYEAWLMSESKRRQQFEVQHPKDRLDDAPIEAAHYEQMNVVARALDEEFNGGARGPDRRVGFVLMVFPFGSTEGRCNYISNGADRVKVVTLMKEMIARFEGQPELKGSA
jgi:hypothetical protein